MAKKSKAAQDNKDVAADPSTHTRTAADTDASWWDRVEKFATRFPGGVRGGLCYLIVASVAYCVFVVNRADPPHIFWDENYHVTSAERYINGLMQFEPHPPLGLMLIAAGEYMSGANNGIDKHVLVRDKQISGDSLPKDFSFAGMRLMPSLFAALAALAFYALLYELLENRWYALLLSSLYVFENAFVVHFRATHLDSFQMFFTIGGLWYFARLWKSTVVLKWWQYAALAAWFACATMIKVNAVVLLIAFPLLYFKDARQQPDKSRINWPVDFLSKSGSAIASILLVFFLVFYAHALYSRNIPEADASATKQDFENMSPEYKQYLDKHEALTPRMVVIIARDYFKFMDKDHKGVPKLDVTKPGENGSHPLHWPFHDRNINYRWDSADGKTSYVQLVGNQLAWYCGTAAMLLSLLLVINYRVFAIRPRGTIGTYQQIETFTILYAAYMILHLWIITQRVLYLYHYFIGLMISYVLLALMWKYLCEVHAGFDRHKGKILGIAVSLFTLSYFFFLPLTNHYPLTKEQCELRNVSISHIVDCN